jgi:hypothetical protein
MGHRVSAEGSCRLELGSSSVGRVGSHWVRLVVRQCAEFIQNNFSLKANLFNLNERTFTPYRCSKAVFIFYKNTILFEEAHGINSWYQ